MSKHYFFVRGTKCKSCEVIIERELARQEGITSAIVSHNKHTLELETENDHEFTSLQLTEILSPHGYTIGNKDKEKYHGKEKINWKRMGGILVLIIATYLVLDRTGIFRLSQSSAEPASLISVFVIGLIASISSCTAVVGGLVAAVASAVAKDQETFSKLERFRPHILFNVGRVVGFAFFGMLIGLLGSVIQLNTTLNGFFVIFIALLMIVIGINLLDLFPTPVIAMPKRLAHKVHDLAESKNPKAPLVLGAMTFFLPCGFTQSMQLYALTLGNPWQAGLVMAVFAFGTMPVLLGIGGMTSFASGKILKRMTFVAGLIVLVLGINNARSGLTLIGFNPANAFAKAEPPAKLNIINGKQFIQMEITEYGTYSPDVLTVVQGTPVEWSIFGGKYLGCANTLVLPAFGVNTYIKSGINTVRFTPTKAGRFTFSCSMGMIRGTMIVTKP
ncbi:MAG: sulfite exporter TauE/SafE family protein [bacterium]|nr:sulfite exporter TauE/SafE family protein [bacterium]